MKLFIISWGGKPAFEDINISKFLGHFNFRSGIFESKVAASIIREKLLEWEKQNLPCSIFSRSCGCDVAIEVLSKQILPNLQRIVLWWASTDFGNM